MLLRPPTPLRPSPAQPRMAGAAPASVLRNVWRNPSQQRVKISLEDPDFDCKRFSGEERGRPEPGNCQTFMQIHRIRVAKKKKSPKTSVTNNINNICIPFQLWSCSAWSLSRISDTPAQTGDAANIISFTCGLKSARPSGDWFTAAILNEYIHVYAICFFFFFFKQTVQLKSYFTE